MDAKIDLHWLACELDHDIKNHAEGLDRVRWNNRAVMLLLREIRGREQLCKELAAALITLLPGYDQYLEWAGERGAFGLNAARANLKIAYAVSKIDLAIATPKAIERAGMQAEVMRTLGTIAAIGAGSVICPSLPDIARIAGELLAKLRACQE